MNYITSCPACETQFLITTEHLKAHGGKVQCGNCEQIFNAKNRLTEVSDDIHSAAEYQASIAAQDNSSANIGTVLNEVLGSVPNLDNLESNKKSAEPYIGVIDTKSQTSTVEVYDMDQINAPIVIDDLTTNPKFDKPKTKMNVWLMLFGLLLAILAGLQSLYYWRSNIASDYPQFKPFLTQACVALNCEIALPKNLDLLALDDSDMQENPDHEKVIKFSSLLINNAPYTQAYPNIELTLTDTADQPVLRKLISPNDYLASDYLASNTNAAAGLASREEIRINLNIQVSDLAVAGYRALLVY